MPAKRRKTFAEQLVSIDREIEGCEHKLKRLHEERKQIEANKLDQELKDLHKMICTTGYSVEEVRGLLESQNTTPPAQQ